MKELNLLHCEIHALKTKIRYLESNYASEEELEWHMEALDELLAEEEELTNKF